MVAIAREVVGRLPVKLPVRTRLVCRPQSCREIGTVKRRGRDSHVVYQPVEVIRPAGVYPDLQRTVARGWSIRRPQTAIKHTIEIEAHLVPVPHARDVVPGTSRDRCTSNNSRVLGRTLIEVQPQFADVGNGELIATARARHLP